MKDETEEHTGAANARLLSWLGAVIVIVLVADQLLGLVAGSPSMPIDIDVHDSSSLRRQLARAVESEGRPILLIGDSVLAGDVLARHDARFRQHRVVDELRAQLHPDDDTRFFQVAANGLLPVDIERIVAELDAVDPDGRVELLIEINLRYFSPQYRSRGDCTREWLCALPALSDPPRAIDAVAIRFGRAMDRLRAVLPVWRHRDVLRLSSPIPEPSQVAGTNDTPETDELLSLARVEGHYRVDLDAGGAQVDALERIARSVTARGRRSLFFATPLRDDFARSVMRPDELGRIYGAIAGRVHAFGASVARFASFDHPLFAREHFVDHVHLTAIGNRLLAINLLPEVDARLALAPLATELIYDHGVDQTLVSAVDVGRVDGPPWLARFDHVGGIAFDPERDRLIIAEPVSHTLRLLRGSKRTVESWLGEPKKPGSRDGALQEARFQRPHSPVVMGPNVFVIDGRGQRIRVISDSGVTTALDGATVRLVELASNGKALFALDAEGSVHWLREGSLVEVLSSRSQLEPEGRVLEHFTVSKSQVVFVTDGRRVWSGRLDPSRTLELDELELIVADHGASNLPGPGSRFPMSFDDVGFSDITTLRYVERYAGVLVSDEVPLESLDPAYPATERTHLRFLHPESRTLHPWLEPYVNENAQFPRFGRSGLRASAFHKSHLALDPETDDLYMLEKHRSRLIRIEDGLHGASRISDADHNLATKFGTRSSREILDTFEPFRFTNERARRSGMRARLTVLYVGSSLIIGADEHGYYELARSLERSLRYRLQLTDRLGVDLYLASRPSATIPTTVILARDFMRLHFIPDFILIDVNEVSWQTARHTGVGDKTDILTQLVHLSNEQGIEVVLIDHSGLASVGRDGLRPRGSAYQAFFDELGELGVPALEPTALLSPSLLEISPWGNPPYREGQHHGSPQAIDRTAEVLAEALAPRLAARYAEVGERDEVTRLSRSDIAALKPLTELLETLDLDPVWTSPRVPAAAARVRLEETRLEVLIDVGKLERHRSRVGADARGLRSVVRSFVFEDMRGDLIDELHVRFVRYANYDEYGQGTLEDAEVLYEATLNEHSLDLLE